MKKILLFLAILYGAALTTYAQSDNPSSKIGVGFDIGGTTGPASGPYPVTGGLVLKAEYPLDSTPLRFVFTTGFTFAISADGYDYEYDSYDGGYTNGSIASFVPVQVGVKYYATNRFFIEGDAGVSFNLGTTDGYTTKKVAPIVTPGAGYTIPFGHTRASMDLSVIYENRIESGGGFGQVALRGVFNFNL